MRSLVPLFALPVACTPEPVAQDTGAPPTPVETGDSAPLPDLGDAEVTFSPTGEFAGSTIGLVWVDPASLLDAQYVWGDTLSSVPAGDGAVIAVSAPDETLLRELDPAGHPGVRGAFFAPVLYIDVDATGAHSAGESVLGIGSHWLFYAADSPSGIPSLPSALRGWNVMQLDLTTGRAQTTGSLQAMPIAASLRARQAIRLEGEWDQAPEQRERIVVHSAVARGDAEVEAPVLSDLDAQSPFGFAVNGAPPADHYGNWLVGESAALEVPEVYLDNDKDRSFTDADSRQYGICSGTTPVTLVYFEQVGTLEFAMVLVAGGNLAGWNAVSSGDPVRILSETEFVSLRTGASCPLVE